MNHSSEQSNTYLSFYLGEELFGANVKHILEVLKGENNNRNTAQRRIYRGHY
jgi:chemotaxis signal transduction protein